MNITVHHHYHHQNDLAELTARTEALELQGETTMGLIEDIQAEAAQNKADAAAERVEVQGKIKGLGDQVSVLTQQVADLQAQIANGGVATTEQLQALKDSMLSLNQDIKDISEPVPAPAADAQTPPAV